MKLLAAEVQIDGKLGNLSSLFSNAERMSANSANKIEANFSQAFNRIGSASKGIFLGLGAAMGGAGLASLKLASNWQQSTIAFTTMLGSAQKGKAMLQELQKFAAKTPFELTGLVQSTQKLLAYGFAAEKIIPTLTSLGDAAAGLGLNTEGLDRVVTAIGQIQAKGKLSAEEMRQLAEAGIPAWEMVATKIGVSIPAAMKMAEKGAISADTAISALTEGMNRKFGGMMALQAKTIGGAWSNSVDAVKMKLIEVGLRLEKTFDISGNLQKFADWVKQLDVDTVKWLGTLGASTVAISGMVYVAAQLLESWNLIGKSIKAALAWATALAVVQGGGAANLANRYMGAGTSQFIQSLSNQEIADIARLPMLQRRSQVHQMMNARTDVMRSMAPAGAGIRGGIQVVGSAGSALLNPIVLATAAIAATLTTIILLFVKLHKETKIFGDFFSKLGGLFRDTWGAFKVVVGETWDTLKKIGSELRAAFNLVWGEFKKLLEQFPFLEKWLSTVVKLIVGLGAFVVLSPIIVLTGVFKGLQLVLEHIVKSIHFIRTGKYEMPVDPKAASKIKDDQIKDVREKAGIYKNTGQPFRALDTERYAKILSEQKYLEEHGASKEDIARNRAMINRQYAAKRKALEASLKTGAAGGTGGVAGEDSQYESPNPFGKLRVGPSDFAKEQARAEFSAALESGVYSAKNPLIAKRAEVMKNYYEERANLMELASQGANVSSRNKLNILRAQSGLREINMGAATGIRGLLSPMIQSISGSRGGQYAALGSDIRDKIRAINESGLTGAAKEGAMKLLAGDATMKMRELASAGAGQFMNPADAWKSIQSAAVQANDPIQNLNKLPSIESILQSIDKKTGVYGPLAAEIGSYTGG